MRPASSERRAHLLQRPAEPLRRLLHGVRLVQDVPAGEFAVRIVGHVAASSTP